MKIENWNNHAIRFVEVDGEWCGIAKDISDALDYRDANSMVKKLDDKYFMYAKMAYTNQKFLALTEFGIYKAIFSSHKPQAEQFQEWVFNIIKQLRQSTGLEGFEVFRLMDKQAVTTSLQVAETFGKNHRDVLKTITNLRKDVRNFAQMFIEGESQITTPSGIQTMTVISEPDIYQLTGQSKFGRTFK